jgi:hypothetical protein
VDAIRLSPHRNRLDRNARRHPDQVEQVPPTRKGCIVTREQTVKGLEQDLKDRYPDAQTVTGQDDSVTVTVGQPNDSIRLRIDADRIQGGSAVLATVLRNCTV